MDHGEITTGAYEQVWHECFNEVISIKSSLYLKIILGSFLAK